MIKEIRAKVDPQDGQSTVIKMYCERVLGLKTAKEIHADLVKRFGFSSTYSPERLSRVLAGREEPSRQCEKALCEFANADIGDIWELAEPYGNAN